MAAPGAVAAALHNGGEVLLAVQLPATGRASDNILALKQAATGFMTDYLKAQHMDIEEVDLMEEVVSDGEGEGSRRVAKKKRAGGRKRKQAAQQPELPKT